MAQHMIDSITVTRDSIYKGAGRLLVSDPDVLTSFPGRLESVMNPAAPKTGTAYELVTGWTDLGPTSDDGVTLRREAELSDGIVLDQRVAALDEGEPERWQMQAEMTLMHTSLANFRIAWEGGLLRAFADDGSHVAQHSLDLDAPASFTQRMAAFVQEDPKSEKLRMFVFRSSVPQVDSEIQLRRQEATGLPLTLKLKSDETVSEGSGQFGKIFEED